MSNALPWAARLKHFLPDIFINNETTVLKTQRFLSFDREMLYPYQVRTGRNKMAHMEKDRYGWYLLIVMACWLLIAGYVSSSFPFLGPDEPRYSQVARQMLESGDWITPRLGANPWFEKPVLLYWLMSGSFRIFGVNEFAARLPSILASLLVAYLIFSIVSSTSDRKRGFLSACLWMTSLFFVGFAHAATFDMLLTACVTAAFYFFFRHELNRKVVFLYCFYFFCGLGILAKGFVAPILVGLPVLMYLIVEHRWKEILSIKPFTGALIVCVVAAIWFLPVSLIHGMAFWDEFVYQHHFVRYTTSHYHTSGGLFYYVPVMLLGTYPWTVAPFLGIRGKSDSQTKLKRFSMCWVFTIVLFFSFSGSKLPGYILPAAPAFFILSGLSLANFTESEQKGTRWILWILTLNLLLIAGLLLAFPQYARESRSIWFMATAIGVCVFFSALLCVKKKYAAALVTYSLIVLAAIYLFVYDFLPESNWNESKQLAFAVQPSLTGQRRLLLYNIYNFDMVFYTNARVELTPLGYFVDIKNVHQLYQYVKEKGDAFVMVGNEELPWIQTFSLWKVKGITRGSEKSVVELAPR